MVSARMQNCEGNHASTPTSTGHLAESREATYSLTEMANKSSSLLSLNAL